MILSDSNYQRVDLSNYARGGRALNALGFTSTNANPGRYYDGDTYVQSNANSFRFSCENNKCGLLVEDTKTNVLLYSSENNAAWADISGTPTRAAATSIINGKTAIKLTSANTTDCIGQNIGTFTGNYDTFYVIAEKGTGATCDIEMYDVTGAASVGKIRFTFSTGAISTITAGSIYSSYAYKITDSGKNSGITYAIFMTVNGTAGNNRRVKFYPSTTAAGYNYFHHAQLEENTTNLGASSPIVTTTVSVTRDADFISSSTIPNFLKLGQLTCGTKCEKTYSDGDGVIGAMISFVLDGSNYIYISEINGNVYASSKIDSMNSISTIASPIDPGVVSKLYGTFANGITLLSMNGVNGSNDTQIGQLTDFTGIYIGSLGGAFVFNGRIFEIRMMNATLSAADMAAITT